MEMKNISKPNRVVYVLMREAKRVGKRLQIVGKQSRTLHNATIAQVDAALDRGIKGGSK